MAGPQVTLGYPRIRRNGEGLRPAWEEQVIIEPGTRPAVLSQTAVAYTAADFAVKFSGKVELGEIEAVLRKIRNR
jgi:hypothetical protein